MIITIAFGMEEITEIEAVEETKRSKDCLFPRPQTNISGDSTTVHTNPTNPIQSNLIQPNSHSEFIPVRLDEVFLSKFSGSIGVGIRKFSK